MTGRLMWRFAFFAIIYVIVAMFFPVFSAFAKDGPTENDVKQAITKKCIDYYKESWMEKSTDLQIEISDIKFAPKNKKTGILIPAKYDKGMIVWPVKAHVKIIIDRGQHGIDIKEQGINEYFDFFKNDFGQWTYRMSDGWAGTITQKNGPTENDVNQIISNNFAQIYKENWMEKPTDLRIEVSNIKVFKKVTKTGILTTSIYDKGITVWPTKASVKIIIDRGVNGIQIKERGINEVFYFFQDDFGDWRFRTAQM